MTTDFITVLDHSTLPLSKRWCADGSILAYTKPLNFSGREAPVTSFTEMAALLTTLHGKRRSCVIRGKFTGEDLTDTVRRLEVFADTEHHWLLIDVDKYQPLEADPVLEPVESIEQYIHEHLPPEFHGASYHWQLSSSAGHPTKPGLRAHLWFWSETPHTSAALKAWAGAFKVDKSLFNPVQPHYTAAPVFDEGVSDPVPLRSGTVRKASDSVPLTVPPALPREPVERGETPADLAEMRSALLHIAGQVGAEIPREDWRNLLFGLHHETEGSDEGLALADEFSSLCREYDVEEVIKLWESARDKDSLITGASILFKARELGWGTASADDFIDAPHDTSSPDSAPRRDPYSVMLRDEVFSTIEPAVWLIRDVLPAARTVMTFGASKSGKTFMVLDMAVALDQGTPWRGHKTRKMRVCYVCAEGYNGFVRRMQAYEKHYKIKLGIGVIRHSPDLMKLGNAEKLGEALRASGGWDIVIVDTMARVMAGADENSGDAGKLIHNTELALQHASPTGGQAMAWFIHHSGKDESKGSRGWSGVPAAMDAEFQVTRDEEVRTLTITKQKDGEEGAKFGFKLRMVPLGIFEPADPDDPADVPAEISSCIVEHTDVVVTRTRTKEPGKHEKTILEALNSQMIDITAGIPREAVLKMAIDMTPEPENGGEDRRRDVLVRALNLLIKHGLVVMKGDLLYLPESAE